MPLSFTETERQATMANRGLAWDAKLFTKSSDETAKKPRGTTCSQVLLWEPTPLVPAKTDIDPIDAPAPCIHQSQHQCHTGSKKFQIDKCRRYYKMF